MKAKLNCLLAFVAVLAMGMAFTSCKKDDDTIVLNGTRWVYTVRDSEVDEKIVIRFVSDYEAIYTWSTYSESETTNYTYEIEDIMVHLFPEDNTKAKLRGLISGNRMSVVNLSSGSGEGEGRAIGDFIKE